MKNESQLIGGGVGDALDELARRLHLVDELEQRFKQSTETERGEIFENRPLTFDYDKRDAESKLDLWQQFVGEDQDAVESLNLALDGIGLVRDKLLAQREKLLAQEIQS